MKKALVFLLAVSMVALLGGSVLAEGRIGFDYGVNGSSRMVPGGSDSADLTGYSLNAEYYFSEFKVGFNYGQFTYKEAEQDLDMDSKVVEFIGGYQLVDGDTEIYLILDYYSDTLEDDDSEIKLKAPLLGLDIESKLNDRLSLESTVAYSLFGADYSGDLFDSLLYKVSDESFLKCGIKLKYQVSEVLGITVGWKYLHQQAGLKQEMLVSGNTSYMLNNNIYTLGATYAF